MNESNFEVLISCMHEKDLSIIQKSNLKCKTLIVNQCVCEKETVDANGNTRMINTQDRGLSKSRNKAIDNAEGDICLIADNDEIFIDNLEEVILEAYRENPKADIIVFKICGRKDKFGGKRKKLGKFQVLKVRSVQISFKLDKIKNNIRFDEKLGAGTELGSGEENKFLLDCLKKGLKIFYVPIEILSLRENESTWFHGFTEEFFYNRGRVTSYIMGKFFAFFYGIFFIIKKRKLYRNNLSSFIALKYLKKGIFE